MSSSNKLQTTGGKNYIWVSEYEPTDFLTTHDAMTKLKKLLSTTKPESKEPESKEFAQNKQILMNDPTFYTELFGSNKSDNNEK